MHQHLLFGQRHQREIEIICVTSCKALGFLATSLSVYTVRVQPEQSPDCHLGHLKWHCIWGIWDLEVNRLSESDVEFYSCDVGSIFKT